MPKKILFFLVICLIFILGILNTNAVFASTTDGTIDSTNKYAWGENIGWLNFGLSNGNVHVTDSELTGYAWSENHGWINMHANNLSGGSVTNDGEGNLGGNAWGESLGWIDFSGVTIDTNGYFSGYATIVSDSSQISFNCSNTSSCGSSDFKVRTDWRPASSRPSGSSGSGGRTVPLPEAPISTEEILGSGECPAELLVTDNMKLGVRNGLYSAYNKGVVKQVAILQAHINRILAAQYKEAAGPVDGIYGRLTKQGVKRLQMALNAAVKPKPLLAIDGIVGPFTKAAINNSCGFLAQPIPTPTPPPAPSFVSAPSEVINPSQNILKENQTVDKNIKYTPTGNNVNNVKTFIDTYLIKPIIKAVIYTSSTITTVFTNFWHGFSAPIIYLFK